VEAGVHRLHEQARTQNHKRKYFLGSDSVDLCEKRLDNLSRTASVLLTVSLIQDFLYDILSQMLPKDLWAPWEPRASFPVFADSTNLISFVVGEGLFASTNLKALARPLANLVRKRKDLQNTVRNYRWLICRTKLLFRVAYLDKNGNLIKTWSFKEKHSEGDFFFFNLNEQLQKDAIPLQDGVLILIANRGRADLFHSSPGSANMEYLSAQTIAGFRTGFFARPVNSIGKGHFGFTGLNPQALVTPNLVMSVLLVNHSSDPDYNKPVVPTIRLYRNETEFLETTFGEIQPHGRLEKTILELFPEAENFLKPTAGRGCTVAQAKGATLASFHIIRNRNGKIAAIDHSRPSHPNVVDYLAIRPKAN
jgi:hypothetical protein